MTRREGYDRILPPRFSNSFIVNAATELAERYLRMAGAPANLMGISFDAVYETILYPDYGIALEEEQDLGFDEDGEKILGRYDPFENVAFIDVSLHLTTRHAARTFTCWHEVGGHAYLQGEWLRQEFKRLGIRRYVTTTAISISPDMRNVLERQANLFAGHAAAPKCLLYQALDDAFKLTRRIRYLGPSYYTLEVYGQLRKLWINSFNDLCRELARVIQWRFGLLSLEALSYRIEQLDIFVTAPNKLDLHRVTRAPIPITAVGTPASYALQ